MKKLIKLLFPKTYQAIHTEGYNQAYTDYYTDYDDTHYCDPHYEYDDDYQQYQSYDDNDYNQYEEDMENQRMYEEYQAELAEEYERECRKAEEFLAEIYNPKPPLLEVGDRIHLHSKQGMYTVAEVYNDSFAYCTQHSELSYTDYSNYKCHAGGRWNKREM